MPPPQQQQTQTQGSQKLFLDLSGRGGLAPRWFGDEGDTAAQFPQYRYLGDQDQTPDYSWRSTASQYASGVYNPSRRYGYMTPSPTSVTNITNNGAGGTFVNEWRCTLYDSYMGVSLAGENGNALNFGTGAGGATWTWDSGWGAIPGATTLTDLESYQVNGVRQVFFAYQKATNGDIGIARYSNGSLVTDNLTWFTGTVSNPLSTTLGTGNDYFFVPASNGYMYMGDGSFIHKIDGTTTTGGTNGTFTGQVLAAPANWTFVDGVDFKNSIFFAVVDNPIGTNDTSAFSGNYCLVYVWDKQSTVVNAADYIPVKGVKNIRKLYVTQNGKLRMICLSSKRTTQIREYDGTVFTVISEAAPLSFPNYRDSFAVAGSMIDWLGSDGLMYSHGAITEGEQEQLYIIGNLTGIPSVSTFTAGAILYADANSQTTYSRTALSVSFKDSNGPYNRIWYPNKSGATPHAGNVFSLVKYFPVPVKINYCRVYHNAGNTSGTTQQGTLSVFLNQATTANKTFAITRNDIAKGYKYCPINQGLKSVVVSMQVEIQWSNVTTADATDWMTRTLEVDYEPISRLL